MDRVFIDANIPVYAAGNEHPNKEPSIRILEKISKGQIFGVTSAEILQEILHRYQSINMLSSGIAVFKKTACNLKYERHHIHLLWQPCKVYCLL